MSGTRVALPPEGVHMKRSLIAGAIACAFTPAFAEEIPTFDLGNIVVTPSRFTDKLASTPLPVTIITSADIANNPSATLPELLSSQAGIHIRNSSGTPDYSIDLRGFGASGNQNTLVLLDGQRLNDLDLSSVKWSAIPLSSIERIEIVRGSGATLYGDNATGGTIHIITKGYTEGRTGYVSAGAGSYGAWNAEAGLNMGSGATGVRLTANQYHSDGYRANNANDQRSLSGDFRTNAGNGQLTVKFGATDQDLRLPGTRRVQPPSINQLETDRRGTATPLDYSTYQSWHVSLGATQKIGTADASAELAYRTKDQSIYNPQYPSSSYDRYNESGLSLLSFTPRMKLPFNALGMNHNLIAGVDLQDWSYDARGSTSPTNIGSPTSQVQGKQQSQALYLQETSQLGRNTLLSMGGRIQQVDYRLNNLITPSKNRSQTRTPTAYEISLRQTLSDGLALFGKTGRSFRLPTVNENYDAFSGTITMLEPQTSQDREVGVELERKDYSLRASVYQMLLNNELHYNAITFTNMNLAPTKREGLELEGRWKLGPDLATFANYTYAVAKFREGVYSGTNVAGNDVPLVPRHSASVGATWKLSPATNLSGVVNYVGEQRFDNDQTNNFGQKMPAYTTVDLKLSHTLKEWTLSAQVNNLLNEKYFSYATRSTYTAGTYTAYPMAERNVWFGAEYHFR